MLVRRRGSAAGESGSKGWCFGSISHGIDAMVGCVLRTRGDMGCNRAPKRAVSPGDEDGSFGGSHTGRV